MELILPGNYEVVVKSVKEEFDLRKSQSYIAVCCTLVKSPFCGKDIYFFIIGRKAFDEFLETCGTSIDEDFKASVIGKKLIAEITVLKSNTYPANKVVSLHRMGTWK